MFNFLKKNPNSTLVKMLGDLKKDPALAAEIYKPIYEAKYYSVVGKGTEKALWMYQYLTYDIKDGIRVLPLFTSKEFILKDLPDVTVIKLSGMSAWTNLYETIETGKCEVAIDPGQPHGIRLTKEMILGMLQIYGTK